MTDDEQREHRNRARTLAAEAAGAWIGQWDGYEGSIVTGYVLIVETTRIGSTPSLTWLTGNGAAPVGDEDGSVESAPLSSWRVLGMCRSVDHEIASREVVRTQRLWADDDDET